MADQQNPSEVRIHELMQNDHTNYICLQWNHLDSTTLTFPPPHDPWLGEAIISITTM